MDNEALEMMSVVPTSCVLSELSLRKERRREALANTSQDTLSQVGGCDQFQNDNCSYNFIDKNQNNLDSFMIKATIWIIKLKFK